MGQAKSATAQSGPEARAPHLWQVVPGKSTRKWRADILSALTWQGFWAVEPNGTGQKCDSPKRARDPRATSSPRLLRAAPLTFPAHG